MRKSVVLGALASLLLVSCGTETAKETTEGPPPTIDVTAADYKFEAPNTIPSGGVLVNLENKGLEPHQAQLFRLNDGVDAAKIIAAAKADPTGASTDKLGVPAGGPNAVDADESQTAITDVRPGKYVFMCLVPDAKGRAHAGLGMVKAVTVTTTTDSVAAPLESELKATTREFDFDLPKRWKGGITVQNVGKQPHEFQVMEIKPGKTPADFEKSFKAPPGAASGPPPWTTGGGVAVIAPGQRGQFEVDLKPGTYYIMCFVADPQRKLPHFALGMIKRFEVKE